MLLTKIRLDFFCLFAILVSIEKIVYNFGQLAQLVRALH